MWTMFCKNVYRWFSQMVSNDMLLSTMNLDFCQKSIVICVKQCLQISIYIYPLTFSNGVTRDVVEYDEFRFQVEIICNAVWRMFANIYLYLPLILSNGVTRHVVECDKLRFQPEIICNAVCEQCLQISIYIYPLFSQMVSHDMLLSMINSLFQPEIICNAVCEQCCVKKVCKYLFMFTPNSLKWCQTTCCWVW